MRTDRLAKLADLLEADAVNPEGVKFDLSAWGYDAVKGNKWANGFDPKTQSVPVNCGTTACALGLAAISGIFKEEGLTFKIDNEGDLLPVFEGWTAFTAAEKFFEIEQRISYQLFDPMEYQFRTGAQAEQEVAQRIRDLITTGNIGKAPPEDNNDDDDDFIVD